MSSKVTFCAFLDLAIVAIRSAIFFVSILVTPYYFPKILYMPVPQVVHLPFMAWRLFFIVTFCVSFMSLFDLHFTQYPTSAIYITPFLNKHIIYGAQKGDTNYKRELIPQVPIKNLCFDLACGAIGKIIHYIRPKVKGKLIYRGCVLLCSCAPSPEQGI